MTQRIYTLLKNTNNMSLSKRRLLFKKRKGKNVFQPRLFRGRVRFFGGEVYGVFFESVQETDFWLIGQSPPRCTLLYGGKSSCKKPLSTKQRKTDHLKVLPSGKLTCPLKRDYFNRKYIFQPAFFRGYVSFQGGVKNSRDFQLSMSVCQKILQIGEI